MKDSSNNKVDDDPEESGNQSPNLQQAGLSQIFSGIKTSMVATDALIDQVVQGLCGGNPPLGRSSFAFMFAIGGSLVLAIPLFTASMFAGQIDLASLVGSINRQPPFVYVTVVALLSVFLIVLGAVSHNPELSACDATSRGLRLTLYLGIIAYFLVFFLT